MRKYCLSFLTICGLLLLAGIGDQAPGLCDVPNEKDGFSISYLTPPNTELDAAGFQNIVPANSVSRSSHPSIDISCSTNTDIVDNDYDITRGNESDVHYKAYLTHNYPSHNFW